MGTGDDHFVIRTAKISTSLSYGGDGPQLMRAAHIVAATDGDITFGPRLNDIGKRLVGNLLEWFGQVNLPKAFTLLRDAHEIDSQLQRITATLRLDGHRAALETLTSHRPSVTPQQRTNAQHATTATVEVGFEMARHHLDTLVNHGSAEMTRTTDTIRGGNDHAASTVQHGASDIVDIRTFDRTRTAYDDIIGGIDPVTAGAVGSQKIIPAIMPDEVGSLAVDGDILLDIALHALARRGVQLYQANAAEISTIGNPQSSRRRVKKQAGVDGVAILHAVARSHFDGFGEMEVG